MKLNRQKCKARKQTEQIPQKNTKINSQQEKIIKTAEIISSNPIGCHGFHAPWGVVHDSDCSVCGTYGAYIRREQSLARQTNCKIPSQISTHRFATDVRPNPSWVHYLRSFKGSNFPKYSSLCSRSTTTQQPTQPKLSASDRFVFRCWNLLFLDIFFFSQLLHVDFFLFFFI